MPAGASSNTRQSLAATPRRAAARTKQSGAGLPCVTSSAAISSGGAGRPAAAMRRSASSRGAEVTTAQRLAGSAARKAATPAMASMPSTSSISSAVIAAASTSGSTPGSPRRRTVSTLRMPWMVGRKASTSSPWRRAQRAHTRSAASIELRIVPSMSNRKAAKARSVRSVGITAGTLVVWQARIVAQRCAFLSARRRAAAGRTATPPHAGTRRARRARRARHRARRAG